MKNEVSPLTLNQIKTVAKRLKKQLPDKTHMQLLDIASHLVAGVSTYHEAEKLSENILVKRPPLKKNTELSGPVDLTSPSKSDRSITYGQWASETPTFKKGDWYYYPKSQQVVFDGDFIPYNIGLSKLSTSSQLLDFILQVQKKKWPISYVKGTSVSPTYQVDNLISLTNDLCNHYFGDSIQSIFSPFGNSMNVNWKEAIEKYEESEKDVKEV